MTPEEFKTFYPHLAGWIRQMLAAHPPSARTVASVGFQRLPLYFSAQLLQSAICHHRPHRPRAIAAAFGNGVVTRGVHFRGSIPRRGAN
jgi:hypothetical protein